jgi:hypothetical protein
MEGGELLMHGDAHCKENSGSRFMSTSLLVPSDIYSFCKIHCRVCRFF